MFNLFGFLLARRRLKVVEEEAEKNESQREVLLYIVK